MGNHCEVCALREAAAKEAQQYPFALPSIVDALEFRRNQMDLTKEEFARLIGLNGSHYSEVIHGHRTLTKKAMRLAYALGVPAQVLLQPTASEQKGES